MTNKLNPSLEKKIISKYKKTNSGRGVAEELGITHRAVRKVLARNGVKTVAKNARISSEMEQKILDTYKELGSGRATANFLGVGETTVRRILNRTGNSKDRPLLGGGVYIRPTHDEALPRQGQIKRYIFTSAQNNTHVHKPFLNNLETYAEHVGAELRISTFAYNRQSFSNSPEGSQKSFKEGHDDTGDKSDLYYDEAIVPYRYDMRSQISPNIVYCGEMNILPTAVNPLSALDTYTGRNSGIFPHAKLAMRSLPVMPGDQAKFNYTTGAVTQRNYIPKKAGLKAEFHHVYCALLVEVDHSGRSWVRQLNATEDGDFYDLDIHVKDGGVTVNNPLLGINWGDVHVDSIDPLVKKVCWGPSGIIDQMRPENQVMHDLLDMHARGHHDMKNCHRMFEKYVTGRDSVEKELRLTAEFLSESYRDYCRTVVIPSNHNDHLDRWLRDENYKDDHVNALFYLEAQKAKYNAITTGDEKFQTVEWALRKFGCPEDVVFLNQDDSFILKGGSSGGIECGLHGHIGPNGARGSPGNLGRLGRKVNMGHTHSPGIFDGVYVAGTTSKLRLSYTSGPTSWAHSEIFTYANTKRSLITILDGKWRA